MGSGCAGNKWVGSIMAVLPLAVTVGKLRLGPGIGARVGSRFRGILRNGLGITVSDKTCITVIAVV